HQDTLEMVELPAQAKVEPRYGFPADASRVVLADKEGGLRLWDVARGQALGATVKPEPKASHVILAPDGRVLTVAEVVGQPGSSHIVLQLWNASAAGLEAAGSPMKISGTYSATLFSPDSTRLIVSTRGGSAFLYDSSPGAGLVPLKPLIEKSGYGDWELQL